MRDRELQITRPDGGVRTVLDTWYSNIDPDTGEAIFHGILVDITGRKNLETKLVEQSIRDPLTGCYNRRYLSTLYKSPRDEKAAGDASMSTSITSSSTTTRTVMLPAIRY